MLCALALALWSGTTATAARSENPRRQRIAFTRKFHVWTMRVDGSHAHRLTRGHVDYNPTWSPDGSKMLFHRLIPDEHIDLFVMSARGKHVTRLTTAKNLDGFGAWSPDGNRIAYTRNFKRGDGHSSQVFLMDDDGGNVEQLTNSAYSSAFPAWSPSGRRIAFTSGRECESRREKRCGTALYVMKADGSDRMRIGPFNRTAHVQYPDWSPNGRWIAYDRAGDCCAHTGIYLVRPSGAKHHRITNNVAGHASWSPDGRWLAVDFRPEPQQSDIWALSRDGERLRRLTRAAAYESTPSWSGIR